MINEVLPITRQHAAYLLSEKLRTYKNTNSIVVAVSKNGAQIGFCLAKLLNISFNVMSCRTIKHPANSSKTIGSISVNDVLIHDDIESIPQDYIYHQIKILANSVKNETNLYNSIKPQANLENQNVILVDDTLDNGDCVLALLRSVRKQNPLRVVVAVPFVTDDAAAVVTEEADELIYLQKEREVQPAHDMYFDFPDVGKEDVGSLLAKSK